MHLGNGTHETPICTTSLNTIIMGGGGGYLSSNKCSQYHRIVCLLLKDRSPFIAKVVVGGESFGAKSCNNERKWLFDCHDCR